MEYIFFDCESANCHTDGNIFSFGYVITDENFNVISERSDILVNPRKNFEPYVKKNILAYDIKSVKAAPDFKERFGEITELLCKDGRVCVGYGVENDIKFLKGDCKRYKLKMPVFNVFDVQKLIVRAENKPFKKLSLEYAERFGNDCEHAHRSDCDAYLTMLVARDVCEKSGQSLGYYVETQAEYDKKQYAAKMREKRRKERERFEKKYGKETDKKAADKMTTGRKTMRKKLNDESGKTSEEKTANADN